MEKAVAVELLKERFGTGLCESAVAGLPHGYIGMIQGETGRKIICLTDGPCGLADKLVDFTEEQLGRGRLQIAPLSKENAALVRMFLKWTAPAACGVKGLSVRSVVLPETGDLQAMQGKGVKPVWMRGLTNEAPQNDNLLDTATWLTLETGFHSGYGLTAGALTEEMAVMDSLLAGFSLVSIDCSAKLDKSVVDMSEEMVLERYRQLPDVFQKALESSYLNQTFAVDGTTIEYTPVLLARTALLYKEALAYVQYLFGAYLTYTPWPIDLEVSFQTSSLALSSAEHFLLGNELKRLKVRLFSMAIPKTTTNMDALKQHAAVAKYHGYRLGVTVDKSLLPAVAAQADHFAVTLASDCSWSDVAAVL